MTLNFGRKAQENKEMSEYHTSLGKGTVIFAEKPSLGKEIAAILGVAQSHRGTRGPTHLTCKDGTIVTWCFGHMLEIPNADFFIMGRKLERGEKAPFWDAKHLPVMPEIGIKHEKKEAVEQLNVMKGLIKNATTLINAGDPDREGQLLVDEVFEHYKWKGETKRLWLSALDEKSIKTALRNIKPNSEFVGLRDAADARGYADWDTGINGTRQGTLKNSLKGLVVLGRVQTPLLSLVASVQRKIENFTAVPFYVPVIDVEHANGKYKGRLAASYSIKTDEKGRITDKSVADNIQRAVNEAQGKGVIKSSASKKGTESAPLPYALSALQIEASKAFGYSADEVLNIAQSLYETHKVATYPRTDCGFLPINMFSESPSVLASIKSAFPDWVGGANTSLKSAAWNDSKVTAHHGIIPTGGNVNMNNLSTEESNVFKLICRNYIAQFYPKHEYEATAIVTNVNGYDFNTTGRVPTVEGWKKIIPVKSRNEGAALPKTHKGDNVRILKTSIENKRTTPPEAFTDGTLIEAMAKIYNYVDDERSAKILKGCKGIGTEATRASIIKGLFDREFFGKKGKKIYVTDRGMALYDAAPEQLKSAVMTAAWEAKIEQIEAGNLSVKGFMKEIHENLVIPMCKDLADRHYAVPPQPKKAYSGGKSTGGKGKGGRGGYKRK